MARAANCSSKTAPEVQPLTNQVIWSVLSGWPLRLAVISSTAVYIVTPARFLGRMHWARVVPRLRGPAGWQWIGSRGHVRGVTDGNGRTGECIDPLHQGTPGESEQRRR